MTYLISGKGELGQNKPPEAGQSRVAMGQATAPTHLHGFTVSASRGGITTRTNNEFMLPTSKMFWISSIWITICIPKYSQDYISNIRSGCPTRYNAKHDRPAVLYPCKLKLKKSCRSRPHGLPRHRHSLPSRIVEITPPFRITPPRLPPCHAATLKRYRSLCSRQYPTPRVIQTTITQNPV